MSKVIGKGVIANRFIDYTFQDKYVLFIESMNDFNSSNFEKVREEELSIKNNLSKYPNSTFVYFSSCIVGKTSVTHSPYVAHKIRMEKIIQTSGNDYLIFRLPKIVAFTDVESSLVNYFVNYLTWLTKLEH